VRGGVSVELGRRNVLGVLVDAVDYEAAVARIVRAARERRPFAVSALAVHGVMTGALDAEHRYRLSRFDLLVPDGQPVRWALRWLHGARLTDRVYGPRLMLELCERAAAERLPIGLFGGTEPLLRALRRALEQRVPGLRIAVAIPSRFRTLTTDERDELVARIRTSGAALTFVGLGCPRQEVSVFELRDRVGMPLIAVGAAFAFHAGELPQAPAALQRRGLEWLFRLAREPRRLWRRYLLLNPLYLALLLLHGTGLKRLQPGGVPPGRELRHG
jgi:N-acetylglucosaminyldiphosphoundecaprenol N-acetyl-beta-D-mannosaminyltransferase